MVVNELPDLTKCKHRKITQGYITASSEDPEVRLRRMGGKCFETVKTGAGLRHQTRPSTCNK